MVQFKGVFLTEEIREYNRAVTSQSVFEREESIMIWRMWEDRSAPYLFRDVGQFLFRDYFKEGAIEMGGTSWSPMGLPAEKMWVTIYLDDDEAFHLWSKIVPRSGSFAWGERQFLGHGRYRPVRTCSEIVIDQGKEVGCGRPECKVGCECDRFLELWNLVFMQFNRDSAGKLHPLAKPCIDTGMGLERISAILQRVKSNYDTDLFTPVIQEIETISHTSYGKDLRSDVALRVIADHSRAATFLISDGVLPSNEEGAMCSGGS